MTDQITDLDGRRGMAAQKATELRRLRIEVETDQTALRARRDELEKFLLAAPSASWSEAVEKARYLVGLFAGTLEAQDPRRLHLIQTLFEDFDRLLAQTPHVADHDLPADQGNGRDGTPSPGPRSDTGAKE
ncbi:hypothetical protein E8L99_07745 [Phreatobacter aquaticus]|uniref:Uncharacterized protein n=1 Tax=Phreatobacter aquaticus TaxID=2570229 RepID=A0A4D7QFK8_9HYPH|nr:hypothetical protein [Phreatobacter aquaticus]QCK85665.1 hypothetical protein E8L99_07745 [Phreatobacter aquaticus]